MLLYRTFISVEPDFNNLPMCMTYAAFSYYLLRKESSGRIVADEGDNEPLHSPNHVGKYMQYRGPVCEFASDRQLVHVN